MDDKKSYKMITSNTFDLTGKVWENISLNAKDLITRLLEPNQEKRITKSDIKNHKWFKSIKLKRIDKNLQE